MEFKSGLVGNPGKYSKYIFFGIMVKSNFLSLVLVLVTRSNFSRNNKRDDHCNKSGYILICLQSIIVTLITNSEKNYFLSIAIIENIFGYG